MSTRSRIHSTTTPRFLSLFSAILISTATAQAIPSMGSHWQLAGPSPYAVEAAHEIVALGGNGVDQTVAAALTLAVTHPYYGALGGGGFALIRVPVAGKPGTYEIRALDFRETAPIEMTQEVVRSLRPGALVSGGLAVGTPGVPFGLFELHRSYGKLPWKSLFAPALRLATKGFPVSGEWFDLKEKNIFRMNPEGARFTSHIGVHRKSVQPGDLLQQPELALALIRFRDQGIAAFQSGPVADDLIRTVRDAGGVLNFDDLKKYKVRWRTPIARDWKGYRIYLMPPPSSGGLTIAHALDLLRSAEERFGSPMALSSNEFHLWAEILKLSFASRWRMGDPEWSSFPQEKFLLRRRIDRLTSQLRMDRALRTDEVRQIEKESWNDLSFNTEHDSTAVARKEAGNTTHLSFGSESGIAVAMTLTLNGSFGSGLATGRFGIFLNNEMDDFALGEAGPNQYGLVQGTANAIAPGKRPLSSMSPTLVEKNGALFAVVGAPGGPRIISAVWQTLIRLLAQNFNADEAVQAPRVHHQFLPDQLTVDRRRMTQDSLDQLSKKGHTLNEAWVGKAYAVVRNPNGFWESAADSRGEAAAGGR